MGKVTKVTTRKTTMVWLLNHAKVDVNLHDFVDTDYSPETGAHQPLGVGGRGGGWWGGVGGFNF